MKLVFKSFTSMLSLTHCQSTTSKLILIFRLHMDLMATMCQTKHHNLILRIFRLALVVVLVAEVISIMAVIVVVVVAAAEGLLTFNVKFV